MKTKKKKRDYPQDFLLSGRFDIYIFLLGGGGGRGGGGGKNFKWYLHFIDECRNVYILKDFENASPRLNPLFHRPVECQRDNCYCIS